MQQSLAEFASEVESEVLPNGKSDGGRSLHPHLRQPFVAFFLYGAHLLRQHGLDQDDLENRPVFRDT